MAVSAEIIDAAECCIVEAGSRVACTLPEKRICDPSIGIVDDSHRRAHRGGKNIGRHGDHAVVTETFVPFTSSARCPASVDETAAVGTAVQRLKASATKESALAPRSMGLRSP